MIHLTFLPFFKSLVKFTIHEQMLRPAGPATTTVQGLKCLNFRHYK